MRTRLLISAAAVAVPVIAHGASWRYKTDTDEMTGSKVQYATVRSDNTMQLSFPYGGTNYGEITVRQRKSDGLSVIVSIDKGQIICDSYYGCNVQVRFDEDAPIKFRARGPSDYSRKDLFLTPATTFVARAAKARAVRIELTIYQAGSQVLRFGNLTPLKWDAPKQVPKQPAHEAEPKAEVQPEGEAKPGYVGPVGRSGPLLDANDGVAVFEITQLPTGEIINVELRKSSGSAQYDTDARRAIIKMSPLPRGRADAFQRVRTMRFRQPILTPEP